MQGTLFTPFTALGEKNPLIWYCACFPKPLEPLVCCRDSLHWVGNEGGWLSVVGETLFFLFRFLVTCPKSLLSSLSKSQHNTHWLYHESLPSSPSISEIPNNCNKGSRAWVGK